MRTLDYSCLSLGFLAMACSNGTAAGDASLLGVTPTVDAAGDAPVDTMQGPIPLTVLTDKGPVVGQDDGTAAWWLGIPYAAPPVGPLRWAPPAPHDAWSAPRDATQFGAACMQTGTPSVLPSEDCLFVNVWRPHTPPSSAPLPIMVFIHGGGFATGAGSDAVYNGRTLATHGHVIVVTLNYRLGPFGFLAHPALTAEDTVHHSSGNDGLLDQQAALRWVQANATAFGGDAHNVTLFGESAGSLSVCAHIASPLASGLFQRAIGESGACAFMVQPMADVTGGAIESGESLGRRFASALGCTDLTTAAACMRAKSTTDVLAAAPTPFELVYYTARYQPQIDGYVLPRPPMQLFASGAVNPVQTLSGTNRNEGTAFALMLGYPLMTATDYQNAITALVPHHVNDALALYPVASYATPAAAYDAFLTDVAFVCPARDQARAMLAIEPHTYLYRFTHETSFGHNTGLGVYHSAELAFVFGNFVSPVTATAADRALSEQVIGYWSRFASTGDPNGYDAPAWPADGVHDPYLDLGDTVTAGMDLHQAACDTIEPWYAMP